MLFLFAWSLSCKSIYAQYASFNLNAANSELPSNETYHVIQDKKGYIWFATDHGVARYNGYKFENFTTDNGLTDNTVFDLQEDEEGNIWFVTFTGGLCYYDGTVIKPHPLNDSIKVLFARQFPTSIKVLKGKNVWMGVVGKGVYKVTPEQYRFFPFTPGGRADTLSIYVLNFFNGGFVYTSAAGAILNKPADADLESVQEFKTSVATFKYAGLNYALVKHGNEIIVGIWQYLIRLSKDGLLDRKEWPRDKKILFLKKLTDGSIWVTNSKAPAYKLAFKGPSITFVDSVKAPQNISDLYGVSGNGMWLTTLDKGVFFLPNRNVSMFEIPTTEKLPITLLAANKKYLYVGLPYNVVMTVDRYMKPLFSKGRDEPVGITGLVLSDSGRVMTNLEVPFSWTKEGFFITKMISYDSTRLLIGGEGGFAIVEGSRMLLNSHNFGFRERVTDLLHVKGKYAIGTAKGLYFLTVDSLLTPIVTREDRLGEIRITALASYSPEKFAFTTRGSGVYLFTNNRYYKLGNKKQPMNSQAECLLFENDSTLWIGTYAGLEKVVFKEVNGKVSYRIWNYNRQDGLPGTQVTSIAAYGGFIWIATSEGLCYFDPANYRFEKLYVPVYFNALFVNGKPRSLKDTVMAFNENNIRIDFGALYYNSPGNIRYKIRLNKDGWIYTASNSAMYYSLPPGKYCLQVQAEDESGKYLSGVQSFYFSITPHFTQTALFKLSMVLLLLLVVAVTVALFFRFQKNRAQNVIKMLQYEFKALNYQINPHFVFNVLNSIQYFVIRKDSEKAVFFLSAFSRLIRKIVSNSKQQQISVNEEIDFLREYLDLERLRLDGKFEYTIEIADNVNADEKTLLPMILQPIVENSIWHGIVPADRLGNIELRFVKEGDCILCEVEDDGVGLNYKNNYEKPKGLSIAISNVKERLKIAAEISGSEWELTIKNKEEVTGTIVTIKFPHAKE